MGGVAIAPPFRLSRSRLPNVAAAVGSKCPPLHRLLVRVKRLRQLSVRQSVKVSCGNIYGRCL